MHYDALKPRLAGVTVRDRKGDALELASLWTDRQLLLAFLRHFG